ncbi:hypothetical protein Q6330_26890, partial [Klebsiella pneumoniae]|nr:hypothetical protein [Klebsiella pneumoniae]
MPPVSPAAFFCSCECPRCRDCRTPGLNGHGPKGGGVLGRRRGMVCRFFGFRRRCPGADRLLRPARRDEAAELPHRRAARRID